MKQKICFFLIAFVAITFSSHAQKQWSEWNLLNNTSGSNVYVSFSEIKTCNNFGYSFYRTKNDKAFPAGSYVYGSFNYTDCDGKEQKEHFTIYLDKTGVDENKGKWYLSNGSGVYGITVEKVYIRQ